MPRKRQRRAISAEAFAELVRRAIADLPPDYAKLMDTVAVVVEEEPSRRILDDLELDSADDLLGLYQGLPLTGESFFQSGGTAPAQIAIYRGPILRQCRSDEEVVQEIYDTVVHELGHHVGLDDDEMPY